MSKAAFTPGPWDTDGYNLVGVPDALAIQISMRAAGGDGSEDEYRANARLIAAAPDMYEALKAALNYLENTESELGMTLDSAKAARAAIAKALGNAPETAS
jgi:hypothetical protein